MVGRGRRGIVRTSIRLMIWIIRCRRLLLLVSLVVSLGGGIHGGGGEERVGAQQQAKVEGRIRNADIISTCSESTHPNRSGEHSTPQSPSSPQDHHDPPPVDCRRSIRCVISFNMALYVICEVVGVVEHR